MQAKVLWDRNTHDAVCCHSNLPSKFSAEFARQKKRKCLAALAISELLDESEDNLRRRGKTILEHGLDEEAKINKQKCFSNDQSACLFLNLTIFCLFPDRYLAYLVEILLSRAPRATPF